MGRLCLKLEKAHVVPVVLGLEEEEDGDDDDGKFVVDTLDCRMIHVQTKSLSRDNSKKVLQMRREIRWAGIESILGLPRVSTLLVVLTSYVDLRNKVATNKRYLDGSLNLRSEFGGGRPRLPGEGKGLDRLDRVIGVGVP